MMGDLQYLNIDVYVPPEEIHQECPLALNNQRY